MKTKYEDYNPCYNPEGEVVETNGTFITVSQEAMFDAQKALKVSVNLLLEKQSEMLCKIGTVYEINAGLTKIRIDLKEQRELLAHIEKVTGNPPLKQ